MPKTSHFPRDFGHGSAGAVSWHDLGCVGRLAWWLSGTGWLVLGRVSVTQIQSDEKRSDSMSSFTGGKLVNNHLKERNDKIQHYIGYVLYLQLSLRLLFFVINLLCPKF